MKVGDIVRITYKLVPGVPRDIPDHHHLPARIVDLKWNMALVRFEDGEQDWIELRNILKWR